MHNTGTKQQTRRRLLHRRSELSAVSRAAKSRAIASRLRGLPEFQPAQQVFCFISYGAEVDTHNLINEMLQQGKQLAVPKIIGNREMIAVPFTDWAELTPGQLGILTPLSTRDFAGDFDITITPGLGFTASGKRLGYGRGYYDKWFVAHKSGHKIALAFECQLLDGMSSEPHDIAVDIIVTENRVIRVS